MLKLSDMLGGVIAVAFLCQPAAATPLRAHAGKCTRSSEPALAVRVSGFKAREGILRIQTYGGDPSTFFEKGRYLDRTDIPVPASGPALLCVPVGRSGDYAVSVRHDMDGDGKTGRADGGGMSGNPRVSVTDLLLKRKPRPDRVTVRAGAGTTMVPITLNYIHGLSFGPVSPNGER